MSQLSLDPYLPAKEESAFKIQMQSVKWQHSLAFTSKTATYTSAACVHSRRFLRYLDAAKIQIS